jgi:hypothetical protein
MAGLDLDCRAALSAAKEQKGHKGDRATPTEDLWEVRCRHADQQTTTDDPGSQGRTVQSLGFLHSGGHDWRSRHHPSHALLLLETMPTVEGLSLPDADSPTGPAGDQPHGGTRTKT